MGDRDWLQDRHLEWIKRELWRFEHRTECVIPNEDTEQSPDEREDPTPDA